MPDKMTKEEIKEDKKKWEEIVKKVDELCELLEKYDYADSAAQMSIIQLILTVANNEYEEIGMLEDCKLHLREEHMILRMKEAEEGECQCHSCKRDRGEEIEPEDCNCDDCIEWKLRQEEKAENGEEIIVDKNKNKKEMN